MRDYLRYPLLLILWLVALMSGAFSIFREVYGIYSGVIPPRSLFWSCTWIAFVVSAAILWCLEYREKKSLKKQIADEEPKLMFGVCAGIDWSILESRNEYVFTLRNYGHRPALYVQIEPLKSAGEQYTLLFEKSDIVLASSVNHVIAHEVDDGTTKTTLYKRSLWDFLHNGPAEQKVSEFDVTINYKDMQEQRKKLVHMRFDKETKELSIDPH